MTLPRVAPAVALAVLAWAIAVLLVNWFAPQAIAWLPAAGSTVTAMALTLVGVVPLIRIDPRVRHRELGFTWAQLRAGAFAFAALWAANQLGGIIDAALSGRVASTPYDLAGFILVGYGEELVFRVALIGAALDVLSKRCSPRAALAYAVAFSTLVFVASHVPHDVVLGSASVLRYASLAAMGVCFAVAYVASGTVMVPAALHVIANAGMVIVAGPHEDVQGIAFIVVVVGIVVVARRRRGVAPS
ncbi:MAG TPA: CPBP family intramembrane glutamic endopeptidase [Kofleriaceae bacterium]